jgi:hypothetical protein
MDGLNLEPGRGREIPEIIAGYDKTIHFKLRERGRIPNIAFTPSEIAVTFLLNTESPTYKTYLLSMEQIINVNAQTWEFDCVIPGTDSIGFALSPVGPPPGLSAVQMSYTMNGQTPGFNLPNSVSIVAQGFPIQNE